MTQPDFQAMNRKDLRAYVLKHRDDAQAFRALVDKLMEDPARVVYPAPQSIDDLSYFPELLKESGREQTDL